MAQELKTYTIELKSLAQEIPDPIVAGANEIRGRTFKVIFSQEAATSLTENTKVWLKWFHQEQRIQGYSAFTKITNSPLTWEISWPKSMLLEGNALCRIELVDGSGLNTEVIATSNNFLVHILEDPHDGSHFILSDDYSEFQKAVLNLSSIGDKAELEMQRISQEFEDMKNTFSNMERQINSAIETANEALEKAEEALEQAAKQDVSKGIFITEY